jgi:hypothetical protein
MVPAVEPPIATGTMTSGGNAGGANTTNAAGDATPTAGTNTMAGAEKPPSVLKTTVVICRFFERR